MVETSVQQVHGVPGVQGQTRSETGEAGLATKLVRITMSAYTRVEYSEVVAVPADATEEELQALGESRYNKKDGGDFQSDPDYWERGSTTVESIGQEEATQEGVLKAERIEAGYLDVSENN